MDCLEEAGEGTKLVVEREGTVARILEVRDNRTDLSIEDRETRTVGTFIDISQELWKRERIMWETIRTLRPDRKRKLIKLLEERTQKLEKKNVMENPPHKDGMEQKF